MASLPSNAGGNKRRVSYFYDGENHSMFEKGLPIGCRSATVSCGPSEYNIPAALVKQSGPGPGTAVDTEW